MHNELEADPQRCAAAVLEMPQEAAENTAQMRKVIVDQIEALAELNRIVAHHGRGPDVVSGNPRRRAAPGRARDGGGRRSWRGPHARHRRQRVDPAAAGLRDADLAPHRSSAGLAGTSDGGRDGWLSDLLNRTDAGAVPSREVPRPRQPQQALTRWSRCRSTLDG